MALVTTWIGAGRKAKWPPNPDFPKGLDVDVSAAGKPSCSTPLPYPAPECGYWFVHCDRCSLVSVVTAAGRPDDPRSLTVPCKSVDSEIMKS